MIGVVLGSTSNEFRRDRCGELLFNTRDGVEEFGTEGYNLSCGGIVDSVGIDITEFVGLVCSPSCPPLVSRERELGDGTRKLTGTGAAVEGFGLERLLARPKMSLAADTTPQLVPPPAPPLTEPSWPRVTPELAKIPGPPSPAAAPGLLGTCEAIVLGYRNSRRNADTQYTRFEMF